MFVGGGAGRGDPGRAGAAGPAGGRPEHLQRPVLGPRLADDLPGRDPDLRGARELRAPADDRRARHGVPAPERAQLLAAAGGGRDDDGELPGAGRRRLQHRLDGLRAAVRQRAAGPAVLHDRRAVRGHLVDHDGAQLHRHDHHDARARHDVLAHAAARVGELHDVAAGRDRDAVRRRLAVPGAARPRAARELLRRVAGRRRDLLPAHLLVLLPPGGLHHDAARASGSSRRSSPRRRASRSSATA